MRPIWRSPGEGLRFFAPRKVTKDLPSCGFRKSGLTEKEHHG